jgi:hypothetical protein
VEVPEDAKMFAMTPNGNIRFVASESHKFKSVKIDNVRAKFIATTDTITEQQASMFVDNMDRDWLYRDYTTPYIHHVYTTALYSFKSLLQHHSITGRHAIIEVL